MISSRPSTQNTTHHIIRNAISVFDMLDYRLLQPLIKTPLGLAYICGSLGILASSSALAVKIAAILPPAAYMVGKCASKIYHAGKAAEAEEAAESRRREFFRLT